MTKDEEKAEVYTLCFGGSGDGESAASVLPVWLWPLLLSQNQMVCEDCHRVCDGCDGEGCSHLAVNSGAARMIPHS